LLDVVIGAEAVKNQLAQFDVVARAAPVLRAHTRHVAAVFAAHVTLGIDLWKEGGARHSLPFQRRLKVVVFGLDFGIAEQRLFNDLVQRHCGRGAGCGGGRCGLCKCCGNKGQGKDRSRALKQKRSHSDYSRVGLD